MHVIGIDPGWDKLGWCKYDLRSEKVTEVGVIGSGRNKRGLPIHENYKLRGERLYRGLIDVLHPVTTAFVCSEAYVPSGRANAVGPLGWAHGVILSVCLEMSKPLLYITPHNLKVASVGHAKRSLDKVDVAESIIHHLTMEAWAQLDALASGNQEHATDATAAVIALKETEEFQALARKNVVTL